MQARNIAAITVGLVLLAALASAQDYDYEQQSRPSRPQSNSGFSGTSAPKAAPIAILKQINRHNEDGSYTYGYEGADGSFKIETKLANGEVKGKYGYADETGKVRVVEYGANRYGFQPAGEGITVAPPTLVDETTNKDGTLNSNYDDGQYYEQSQAPAPRPAPRPQPRPQQQQQQQPQQQPQFDFNSAPRFAPAPAQRTHAAPVPARAQISGAAPVEIDYSSPPRYVPRPQPAPVHNFAPAPRPAPQRFSFADTAPAPVAEDIRYAEPAPRPQAPRQQPPPQYAQPAPHRPAPQQPPFRPAPTAPQYAPRPQGQPGRGGILDQLARDYALPADSAAPLHDISFGYY